MSALSLSNVYKRFGATEVLKGINLEMGSGDFTVLVGPSGCGKSSLLNIIAGLERQSSGSVEIGGRVVDDIPPKDRNIAMVFQSYALYPSMTVRQNITFGMECRNVPRAQRNEAVARVAKLLQIDALLDRKPSQLSGGQRQRVALARALAIEPNVLLLDEPFGALDAKVRKSLRRWLKALHDELHVTTILVTHDQEEALEVANRVVVMGNSRIEQVGTPAEIYDEPANSFVFDFIGESVKLPVTVDSETVWVGSRPLPANGSLPKPGPAQLFVRPHDLTFSEAATAPLQGAVRSVRRVGAASFADIRLDFGVEDHFVEATIPANNPVRPGDRVGLTPRRFRIFDPSTGPQAMPSL
jgi:sulfate transport system ATP-binding protein